MQCMSCRKEISDNLGTVENPICTKCYNRMVNERAIPESLASRPKPSSPLKILGIIVAIVLVIWGVSAIFKSHDNQEGSDSAVDHSAMSDKIDALVMIWSRKYGHGLGTV